MPAPLREAAIDMPKAAKCISEKAEGRRLSHKALFRRRGVANLSVAKCIIALSS